MKEKVVIEKELLEKIIKASPIQWFDNKEKTENLVLFGKEYKTEKEPTNWEELKELCEDLESKDVFITSAGDCIEYHGLQFWVSGTVCHETEKFYSIKSDRTPQQMWQIIKNLIGE